MKTAIYMEDGVLQLVLTPTNEFEKKALANFEPGEARVENGSFYECQGGFHRQGSDRSVILIAREEKK